MLAVGSLAVGSLSCVVIFAVKADRSSSAWFVCLSGLFCLSLISRLYGAGSCWHRLSGVRTKLVNH